MSYNEPSSHRQKPDPNPPNLLNADGQNYRRYYEQTTNAIKKIAGINIIMMFLTVGLVFGTWWQACLVGETLHDSERAFVYCSGISIDMGPDINGHALIIQTLNNSGLTQARRVRATYGFETVVPAPPPGWDQPENHVYKETLVAFVNLIGSKAESRVEAAFDSSMIDDLKSKKTGLFTFGTVRYCDIFYAPHVTRFCKRFEEYEVNSKTGEETFSFGPCMSKQYNCDDDDCPTGQDTPKSYCE